MLPLTRPDKLNAITGAVSAALDRALDAAEADDSVRAIVVVGAGRAFSAGFDLDMGVGDGRPDPADVRRALENDFRIIMRFWDIDRATPLRCAFMCGSPSACLYSWVISYLLILSVFIIFTRTTT